MIGGFLALGNGGSSGGGGLAPRDVTNLNVASGDGQLVLSWKDPADTVVDGKTICAWDGTIVVQKEGSAPTSEKDGTVILNTTTRDYYETRGFTVNNLQNDHEYYFGVFPYSTTGAYNTGENNRIRGTPKAHLIFGVRRLINARLL